MIVTMPREPIMRDHAGDVLAARMREVGLNQTHLARMLGYKQTWASQSLFGDTERQFRRWYIDTPEKLDQLAKILRWTREEMLQETRLDKVLGPLPTSSVSVLNSASAVRIGIPGKPVRPLARAGKPMLPGEGALFHFPIPARHDQDDLELYQYDGALLTIGTSFIQEGDIIAMIPVTGELENGRAYVIRTDSQNIVARCARAGKVVLFVTDDAERDAIPEGKAHVLGRIPRFWNQHEA